MAQKRRAKKARNCTKLLSYARDGKWYFDLSLEHCAGVCVCNIYYPKKLIFHFGVVQFVTFGVQWMGRFALDVNDALISARETLHTVGSMHIWKWREGSFLFLPKAVVCAKLLLRPKLADWCCLFMSAFSHSHLIGKFLHFTVVSSGEWSDENARKRPINCALMWQRLPHFYVSRNPHCHTKKIRFTTLEYFLSFR